MKRFYHFLKYVIDGSFYVIVIKTGMDFSNTSASPGCMPPIPPRGIRRRCCMAPPPPR